MICPGWGRNPGTHRRPYERVPQECPNRGLAPHPVSTLSILMHPIDGCDKLTPSFADGMFPIVTLSSSLVAFFSDWNPRRICHCAPSPSAPLGRRATRCQPHTQAQAQAYHAQSNLRRQQKIHSQGSKHPLYGNRMNPSAYVPGLEDLCLAFAGLVFSSAADRAPCFCLLF